MKVIRQRLLISYILWFSASANALSCVGLSDRFFIECNQGACAVEFRAREIPSLGSCSRQLVIESVDPRTSALILALVPDKYASRFLEVSLIHRYYGDHPSNATELDQSLKDASFRAPRVLIKELPSGTSLRDIRDVLESQAKNSKLESLWYWTVEITFLLLGLLVLYRSATVFHKRLLGANSGTLLAPIAFQLAIFVAAIACLSSSTWLIFFGLLAPLTLLVFIAELAVYIRQRLKSSG
jgi:hypothetical protein